MWLVFCCCCCYDFLSAQLFTIDATNCLFFYALFINCPEYTINWNRLERFMNHMMRIEHYNAVCTTLNCFIYIRVAITITSACLVVLLPSRSVVFFLLFCLLASCLRCIIWTNPHSIDIIAIIKRKLVAKEFIDRWKWWFGLALLFSSHFDSYEFMCVEQVDGSFLCVCAVVPMEFLWLLYNSIGTIDAVNVDLNRMQFFKHQNTRLLWKWKVKLKMIKRKTPNNEIIAGSSFFG